MRQSSCRAKGPLSSARLPRGRLWEVVSLIERLQLWISLKNTGDWEVLRWLLERKHIRGLDEVLTKDVFEPAGIGRHPLRGGRAPARTHAARVRAGGREQARFHAY
jgi:hypothetical protein